MKESRFSDYDPFAWIYNIYWGSFAEQVMPVLEELLLAHLAADAYILDLCCGTGQLAQALVARGYQVTGLDGSQEMIRFARENAPEAEFVVADARTFTLPAVYDGVVSTFDSLNHIMTSGELTGTFGNVYAALREGGLFLFDLNMEEGYQARWQGTFAIVEDDHVVVVRARYDAEERVGRNDITLFYGEDDWQRTDLTLTQKCYTQDEIMQALTSAGFTNVKVYDAQRDLRRTEVGRSFFICRK